MPDRSATAVADHVAGAVIVAFGGAVLLASRGLDYTSTAGPGPGFLPTWLGAGLVTCGALIIATRLRSRAEEPLPLPGRAALSRVAAAAAALVAVGLLLEPLGFALSAAALVLFCVLGLARRSLPLAIALAVALPAAFSVIFILWLDVRLPRGIFGF